MATHILPCRRIETTASVNSNGSCDVIVDTGADVSLFPYHELYHVLKHGSVGPGIGLPIGGSTIHTMTALGLEVTVDAEPPGGGRAQRFSCVHDVLLHFAPSGAPFANLTTQGLAGIDLLDALGVDPAKALNGQRAYLARRV